MIKLIVVAALLGSAATAFAAPVRTSADLAPTVRIHTTDLDPSRPDDMKMLRHRVSIGINTVCGWPMDGSMGEVMANARCRHAAVHSADRQIAALKEPAMLAQADTRRVVDQH